MTKPGKDEKRPLGIPAIEDRARQALVKLAIEPEWEAKFEPNSYGFRPARNLAGYWRNQRPTNICRKALAKKVGLKCFDTANFL